VLSRDRDGDYDVPQMSPSASYSCVLSRDRDGDYDVSSSPSYSCVMSKDRDGDYGVPHMSPLALHAVVC
jgi:hypothetical protein